MVTLGLPADPTRTTRAELTRRVTRGVPPADPEAGRTAQVRWSAAADDVVEQLREPVGDDLPGPGPLDPRPALAPPPGDVRPRPRATGRGRPPARGGRARRRRCRSSRPAPPRGRRRTVRRSPDARRPGPRGRRSRDPRRRCRAGGCGTAWRTRPRRRAPRAGRPTRPVRGAPRRRPVPAPRRRARGRPRAAPPRRGPATRPGCRRRTSGQTSRRTSCPLRGTSREMQPTSGAAGVRPTRRGRGRPSTAGWNRSTSTPGGTRTSRSARTWARAGPPPSPRWWSAPPARGSPGGPGGRGGRWRGPPRARARAPRRGPELTTEPRGELAERPRRPEDEHVRPVLPCRLEHEPGDPRGGQDRTRRADGPVGLLGVVRATSTAPVASWPPGPITSVVAGCTRRAGCRGTARCRLPAEGGRWSARGPSRRVARRSAGPAPGWRTSAPPPGAPRAWAAD
jgi:hypothetical protein